MKIAPLSHASSLFGSVRLGLYDLMFNKHIICGYTFCCPLSETVHLYYCAAFTIDPPPHPSPICSNWSVELTQWYLKSQCLDNVFNVLGFLR